MSRTTNLVLAILLAFALALSSFAPALASSEMPSAPAGGPSCNEQETFELKVECIIAKIEAFLEGFSMPQLPAVPTLTPAAPATEEPAAPATEEPEGPNVCGVQAKQLSFWAVNDQPETFEIDSRGKTTHLQLWLPGVTPTDVEISVILTDQKVKVVNGGGTGWQWDCLDEAAARADALASGQRRASAGKITWQMTIEQINAQYPGTIVVLDE